MAEWFRDAFGTEYLSLYSHRDEDEARATVSTILGATGLGPGARVLDSPCGAGRHSRQFAAEGLRVDALDLSLPLLRVAARSPVARAAAPTRLLRADLRHIPLAAGRYDLVANLFSSIGYFEDESDNQRVIDELGRMLAPGGILVIDTMNEPYVRATLVAQSQRETTDGLLVRETRAIRGAPPRVIKESVVDGPGRSPGRFVESVRLYTARELEESLGNAGLEPIGRLGDYAGGAWTPASPRLVVFARSRR